MEIYFLNSSIFYILFSTVLFIYWYLNRNYNYWSKYGLSGPKPLPGFGNFLSQFLTPKPYLFMEWQKKYGKIYGVFTGNRPRLMLADPELIKNICVKDFHIFTDRDTNRRLHPILSRNLLAETGDDWKRIRSIVTPTFTSGKMKRMYPMIRECLNEFLNILDTYANDGRDVNVKEVFGNFSMDVIATTAFATKTNSHRDADSPFVQNALNITQPAMSRLISLVLLPKFVNRLLNIGSAADDSSNEFFFNITRHIIAERKNSNKKYNDFVQMLLNANKTNANSTTDENDFNDSHHVNEGEEERNVVKNVLSGVDKKYLTDDEILAQCWIFFIAGYETTSTTLTFCSYELALNPNVQERLYEEVMSAVDSKGDIDYDVLARLPYLDSVIAETLRLHTPALMLSRLASRDYKLGDTGITILKGQQIEIPIFAIHRNEEFYENPLQFMPERFMPENRHKIIPYSYLPFGAGPRSCVGMRFALMEAKLALVQIVQRYRFFRSGQTEVPLILNKNPILHSPKRVVVGIEKRK